MTIIERSNKLFITAFLLLLALFSFSRFYNLTARPFHNDEAVNGFFVDTLIKSGKYSYDPVNYHGPSIYFFQYALTWVRSLPEKPFSIKIKTSGLTEMAVRTQVAIFGILTLFSIFLLRIRLGHIGTLFALFLAGTSCDLLFFSRYFIHETLVVFFTFWVYLSASFWRETKKPIYIYLLSASISFLYATKETSIVHFAVLFLAFLCTEICSGIDSNSFFSTFRKNINHEIEDFIRPAKSYLFSAFILGFVIWFLLFSSFLTNPRGLIDSVKTYFSWTREGLESIHNKEFIYYIREILIPYELPLFVFTLIGIPIAFLKKNKQVIFISFWALGMTLAYSFIPYKTPWILINFLIPMCLISGYAIKEIYNYLKTSEGVSNNRTLSISVFSIFLIPLLIQIPLTYRANYIEFDFDRHRQVYAHSSREVFKLISEIKKIAKKTNKGNDLRIQVVAKEYWPIPFYLRDFTNLGFYSEEDGVQLDAPIIIADTKQAETVKSQLKEFYAIKNYSLRPGRPLHLYINNSFIGESLSSTQSLLEFKKSVEIKEKLKTGLKVSYYSGTDIGNKAQKQLHWNEALDFNYTADPQKPIIPPWSGKWEGYLKVPMSGKYIFHLSSDDGSWLLIDDQLTIDNSGEHARLEISRPVELSEGFHKIQINYFDIGGGAELTLEWTPPGRTKEQIRKNFFWSK
ncbi:MAG: flippase activity-associated protein Agl23 [Elusimicrobiota bacterium]